MSKYSELADRLERLVIMDEVGSNNPLAREAAAALRELEAELKTTYWINKHAEAVVPDCPRVALRIECPECGYPASEALHMLSSTTHDPGHREG